MSIPNAWKRRATKTSVNLEQSTHFQFTVDLNNNEGALNTNSFIYSRSTTSQHIDTNPTVACISSPVSITGHAEERIFDCVFASEGHDVSRLWSSFASPEGQREKEEEEIPKDTSGKGQEHEQGQGQEQGEREREKQIQSTSKGQDKKWIATCGQDGSCRLWCLEHDAQEGEQISECFVLPCYSNAECLRMSWGDGLTRELIATSGANGVVMLWNARDEQLVQSLICKSDSQALDHNGVKDDTPQVYACELFGGQSTLFMGAYDDRVVIWDVTSAQPVVEWKFSATASETTKASSTSTDSASSPCYVYGAALGGANTQPFIAVALSDGSMGVIDPRQATSNVPAYRWKAHAKAVSDCVISKETPWTLASCSSDGLVKVWDLRCVDKGPRACYAGHTRPVFGVDFWGNDQLVSWSNDGSLRSWSEEKSSVLYMDSNYMLHGCSKSDDYIATCGGASGTGHQPACWKMHKVVK